MKNSELRGTMEEFIPVLLNEIEDTTALFQEGKDKAALKNIPSIAEKLSMITAALDVLQIEITVDMVNEKLVEIVEALENDDYILVADLFNYEVKPMLNEILERIK